MHIAARSWNSNEHEGALQDAWIKQILYIEKKRPPELNLL